MNKAILVVILVLACYTAVQLLTNYKTKSDLGDAMERQLDMVDEKSFQGVTDTVVQEAKKLGVDLKAEDVQIRYEGTDIQSYAQRVVGGKLGAQFQNKRVTIIAEYTAHVDFIPVRQEIEKEKIRQVAAPQIPASKAAQELLDAN